MKTSINLALGLITLSLFATSAQADWHHAIPLKSANGSQITISYDSILKRYYSHNNGPAYDQDMGYYVKDLYVDVNDPSLDGAQIRAVILPVAGQNQNFLAVNLTNYGNGHFSGRLLANNSTIAVRTVHVPAGGVAGCDLARASTTVQEVAIVVNDTWLKDPVSGNSNFKFSMLPEGSITSGCPQ